MSPRKMIFLIIIFTLLAACAAPAPDPTPTPIPEPTSCAEVDEICIEVVFSENGCTYAGPDRFPPGIVYIEFTNQRAERARMGLWPLLPDRTIQDWQAGIGPEPSTIHHTAQWFLAAETARAAGPGGGYLRKEELTIPGGYVLDCFVEEPYQLWFAGGFVVE